MAQSRSNGSDVITTSQLSPPASQEADLQGTVVTIEKLIPEGKGLGRLADGRVVLAEGVTPGDRIELRQFRLSKSCITATQWQLSEASAARTTPRCKVWKQCGGCDWMMLDTEGQRIAKQALVVEALRRTGKFERAGDIVKPCMQRQTDGYRSRVRMHIVRGRLGFFARASRNLVEPEHCPVTSGVLNLAITAVRDALAQAVVHAGYFEAVELRECANGRVSLTFSAARSSGRRSSRNKSNRKRIEAGQQLQAALGTRFLVATEPQHAEDRRRWQRFSVALGTDIFSPPGGFTQIHWSMNRLLVGLALEGVRQRAIGNFLDLYCGAGNFTLPLLALGLSGTAVEGSELSVQAARYAASLQGFEKRIVFRTGDVPTFTARQVSEGETYDLVLIDPPRAGVSQGLLDMVQLSSGWILMCSCNPVTLARDLRILVDSGCTLESVQPLDMFPQTHHVETLVWLRSPAKLPRDETPGAKKNTL